MSGPKGNAPGGGPGSSREADRWASWSGFGVKPRHFPGSHDCLPSATWHWRSVARGFILGPMESQDDTRPIRVGAARDGSLTYLVDLPPEALPPVTRRDLERAWYAARRAALAEQWGAVRVFRFARSDGSHSDLVLADRDASCWAAALDAIYGIGTRQGLSLCLRLLALIDLLAQSPWAVPLVRLARDGAEPDPALLHAAATEPLTHEARFDQAGFRTRLARYTAQRLTGVSV